MNRAMLKVILIGANWFASQYRVQAQTPAWLAHWATQEVNVGFQGGFKIAIADNGEILCIGTQSAGPFTMDGHGMTINGASDMVIAKLDPQGQALWAFQAGGDCPPEEYEGAGWLVLTEQGNAAYTLGWFQSPVALFGDTALNGGCGMGESDVFITRNNVGTGEFVWARAIRGWSGAWPNHLLVAPDETAWVFGNSNPMGAGIEVQFDDPSITLPPGCFLVKYDSQGLVLEAENIMNYGGLLDAEWSGTNILIGGCFTGQDSLWNTAMTADGVISDGFVAMVDQAGVPQWIATLAADSMARVMKVAQQSDGTVIAAGTYSHRLVVGSDTIVTAAPGYVSGAFIASLSSIGELNWLRPLENPNGYGPGNLFDLQVGPDDAIYLQGRFSGTMTIGVKEFQATTDGEMFVAKLNSAGDCTAMLRMGRMSLGVGGGSVVPQADAVFVSGMFDSTMVIGQTVIEPGQIGVSDFFVAKFDSLSGFTGINAMPLQPGELVIYANPNRGTCTIQLPEDLQHTEDLVLTIMGQTGQVVQRMPLRAGAERVAIDIRAQAKGIYHLELSDGKQRYSGRVVFE